MKFISIYLIYFFFFSNELNLLNLSKRSSTKNNHTWELYLKLVNNFVNISSTKQIFNIT